jgi:ADP-ribose pyrophosphatase
MDPNTKRRVLHDARFVRLVIEDGWEYAERKNVSGIVAVVAITEAREIVLVEQYRQPVRRPVIELPAGLAGDQAGGENEPLEAAARRELLEEAGFEAPSFERLAEGPPSAGITDEVITFFRARGARRVGGGGGDATETIRVHVVPLASVDEWLRQASRRAMVDPKVYAGLYFAR